MIDKVAEAREKRMPTGELNRFVQRVTAEHPPASPGRKEVRILYATQKGVCPPTFVFFTNVATEFHFSYERYLVNQLRETFGLMGTPIQDSRSAASTVDAERLSIPNSATPNSQTFVDARFARFSDCGGNP